MTLCRAHWEGVPKFHLDTKCLESKRNQIAELRSPSVPLSPVHLSPPSDQGPTLHRAI